MIQRNDNEAFLVQVDHFDQGHKCYVVDSDDACNSENLGHIVVVSK